MSTSDTLKEDIERVYRWLEKEFSTLRVGAPSLSVLDSVTVSHYNTPSKLPHIAAITLEDSQTLVVSPYDKELLDEVRVSIERSLEGVSVRTDKDAVYVTFAPITTEGREALKKEAEQIKEQAKVRIKIIREKVMQHLEAEKKEGTVSEDETRRKKEETEKTVQDSNARLKQMTEDKKEQLTL